MYVYFLTEAFNHSFKSNISSRFLIMYEFSVFSLFYYFHILMHFLFYILNQICNA
jgi:hypothetical protein